MFSRQFSGFYGALKRYIFAKVCGHQGADHPFNEPVRQKYVFFTTSLIQIMMYPSFRPNWSFLIESH